MFFIHQPVGGRPTPSELDSYLFWSGPRAGFMELNLHQFFQGLNPNWLSSPLASRVVVACRIPA